MGAMMRGFLGVLAVAASLFLLVPTAHSADAKTCASYVREALAKAEAARSFACGYDLSAPRWSTDRSAHLRWCRATRKSAVTRETTERRARLGFCRMCRAYADLAAAATADNAKLACGFEGPRWASRADAHFQWCMALREGGGAGQAAIAVSYKTDVARMKKTLDVETGYRVFAIAECRSSKQSARGDSQ